MLTKLLCPVALLSTNDIFGVGIGLPVTLAVS